MALSAILGATALVPTAALASDITDQAPAHHKTITDNGDGTYDLALSVIGDAAESEYGKPIDVVVVVDVSTSMNEGIGGGSRTSKMQAAKNATKVLADTLLNENNSKLPENQQIKMSVVTFGTHAQTVQGWTTDANAVYSSVPSRANQNQGTNWEAGLSNANSLSTGREGAEKYIVFLSDGNATYRDSKYNDRADDYNWGYQVYGTGNSDRNGWNYGAAKDEANKRGTSVGMFAVSISNDATKMQSFAKDTNSTFLDGTSEEKVKTAFEQIAQTIKKSAFYKDVKIVDKLSQYVDFNDVVNVRYEKGTDQGTSTWTDAPQATISGDTLTWDLSTVNGKDYELEKGATYKVIFTIKPNQKAYDAAAAAGKETELPSNDATGTKVYYKTIVKETGKPDQVSDEKSDGYEEPTIKVPVDTVTVTKAWENTGDAQLPASVTVQLKKNGQNYGAPFQLTAADNWIKTVTVPAGVGQLTWAVEEDAVDGYVTTYSDAVTGSGTLTVTNTHETWPVTLEGETAIKGTKTLTGHDMTSAFNFKLTAAENYGDKVSIAQGADTASVSGAKDGEAKSFSFGAVTFYESGTYKFNVTETGAAPAGYTYDTHTSVVTVEVVEKDGKLVATTSYEDGASCVFKNSYEAKPVTVDGAANFSFTKVLEGRDLKAGEFSFQIEATSNNNAPLPELTTVKNTADGTVSFGDITYNKAGVYTYEVSEVTDDLPGGVTAVTQGAKQVTVTVTDNNEGQLVATVATPEDKTFKNTYKADSTTIESLLTTKVIKATQDGVTPPALKGGDFSFTISSTDGPLPEQTTVTNDASGSVAFGKITFTEAGEYHYTITESGSMPGVTNDAEAKTFTVTVVDNGDGTMTATASKIAGFENTYTVKPVEYSVTADVDVTKSLEGRALNEGEFTFQLVDGDEVVAEATNGDDGKVYFKALTYTAADLGEHTYKVREVKGSLGGVTYDTSEYTVKVTVSDNGDGTLSAKASTESGEGITFKNTYKTEPVEYSVTTDVDVTKSLEGRTLKAGEFSFQLVDAQNNVVDTATNAADGKVSFKAQTYTAAGDYVYTVKEVQGTLGGVTYDESTYTVTVTVTDNGDGTLSAKAATESDEGITFKNKYASEPAKLTSGVEVTKNLEGRDWTDDDKFTFVITAKDANNPMPSNGTTGVATKAGKTVSFNDFTFNEAGTYEYTVAEQGTDGEGVTYDTHEATVTITVVDNGEGKLVATPVVANGTFNNTYKAGTASVTFGAAKVLSGATLKDGQFSFQLKDADGNVVETAKNDANGNIKFSQEFTAAGEYKFTISEVNDHQADVTYDTKSYDVTVTVTDNGKGQLEAKVSGASVVFNNTYTEPKKEEKKEETKKDTKKEATPKTGDALLASEAIAAIAGTGVLGVVASRIRRKK
ncbi:MAG: FctA domain-containing protein [Coriobacteriia bacterium]|nr:FctA domain-containing protein [Coriobacteriia bacterium]